MILPVIKALRLTFRQWRYALLALTVTIILLLTAIWLPNLSFLWHLFTDPRFSWATKFGILGNSLAMLKLNSTPASQIILFIIVTLAGINVSFFVHYLKRRLALGRELGVGLLGTILGLTGVGCVSCGSVALSFILGISATAVFLAFLPLQGLEFGLAGILLLIISIVLVSKKIISPLSCAHQP